MITNHIKNLRKNKGWSQEKLAKESGFLQSEISMWENNARSINNIQLASIAKALGIDAAEIISNSTSSSIRKVPIIGRVGAGAVVIPIDENIIDEVECPLYIDPNKGVALEVVGDSMEPLISDGFLLFYEERINGMPPEYIGKICIVEIDGGETYVKKVRKGNEIGKYNLISLNPEFPTIENIAIKWSAMVKVMVQR